MAQKKKDYSQTRKPISKSVLGRIAEVLGIKEGLSDKQKSTKKASLSQKVVRQAMKRAGIVGFTAAEVIPRLGAMLDASNTGKVNPAKKPMGFASAAKAKQIKTSSEKAVKKALSSQPKKKVVKPKPRPKAIPKIKPRVRPTR